MILNSSQTKILSFTLIITSFFFIFISLTLGPGNVSVHDVWQVLTSKVEHSSLMISRTMQIKTSLVWDIRLPRSLLAFILGAALGCGGTLTQGIFRNPLASPNVLGISSGAALAVIVGFAFGIDELAFWVIPLLAAIGAIITFGFLYLSTIGNYSMASFLLSGVALATLFSALITLMLSLNVNNYEVTIKIMQWLLGNLEAKSWQHLLIAVIFIPIALLASFFFRNHLDALHLGEETSASLGLNIARTYILLVLLIAVLIGTATSLSGIIGFIGLIIPHIARLSVGAKHARTIPLSMLLGGSFLLLVDNVSRLIIDVYLPPGVITSLIGAPLFLWLVRKNYRGAT